MTGDPLSGMLDLYCHELKLPGLRAGYPAIARDAVNQGQSYSTFLAACLAHEIASRREHRLTTRLAQARFPVPKTLSTFDFAALPQLSPTLIRSLAEGTFISQRENVILLGNPGTGKTHIATAIGTGCIQAGYRVRFIAAVTLAQDLLAAQQEYRLPRYLKSWQPTDLVILDELGYLGLGPGGPLLFQFCAERYERGSILITTNLDFARWVEVFSDATLTSALLDRLTHHAHIVLFQGESFRFKESKQHHKEVSQLAVAPA